MEDIIRLIVTAIFALFPLWLLIARMRNRAARRAAAAQDSRTERMSADEADTEQRSSMIETDTMWGSQYFRPVAPDEAYGDNDVQEAETEAETEADVFEEEMDEDEPTFVSSFDTDEEMEDASIEQGRTTQHKEDSTAPYQDSDALRVAQQDAQTVGDIAIKTEKRMHTVVRGRYLPLAPTRADLKQAVIFSEILGPCRGMNSFD